MPLLLHLILALMSPQGGLGHYSNRTKTGPFSRRLSSSSRRPWTCRCWSVARAMRRKVGRIGGSLGQLMVRHLEIYQLYLEVFHVNQF